jgi:hypothetical protein
VVIAVQAVVAFAGPSIDVWYGANQEFGQIGMPIPMVNVLGTTWSTNGIASLSYSLNGGSSRSLSVGPNSRRLAETGDFNVELAFADLAAGANSLAITAVDGAGQTTTTQVTVTDSSGSIWPLPYGINWGGVSNINSVAQITDGQWYISGGAVRTTVAAYDRLIAIGDQNWQDYEVSVPVVVHSLNQGGYAAPSNGPAVGLVLRWPGNSYDGNQPMQGIYPLGAIAMYRWTTSYNRFEIFGNNGTILDAASESQTLSLGTTYTFSARVETIGSAAQYSFKWWASGASEPASWQLIGRQSNGPSHGCLLLLAHQVDASFGQVSITSLYGGSLQVTITPAAAVSAGAQWRRAGTSTWHDSGQTESGLSAGQYTVEFKDVSGWTTPAEQSVTISDGRASTTEGMYVVQTGNLGVTIEPADAVAAGAAWRRVGTETWGNSGDVESGIPVGEYTLEFASLDGWYTPAEQTVTIAGGQTASVEVSYVRQPGRLRVVIEPTAVAEAGAQWRRLGTEPWGKSGEIEPNISTGEYTLEFDEVAGWNVPPTQTVVIEAGKTTEATAVYTQQVGNLQITILPQEAVDAGAQWQVLGQQEWHNSGDIISSLIVGSYTIQFSSITEFGTPPSLAMTVAADQTATAVASYSRRLGSLQVVIEPEDAVQSGAQWRVDNGDWHSSGDAAGSLAIGIHEISFSGVDGYGIPEPISVTIVENETALATGMYVEGVGPVVQDIEITVEYETAQIIQLIAEDPDGQPLMFAILDPPEHGSLDGLNADTGLATYTPAQGYSGADQFTFTADDGHHRAEGKVSITVAGPSEPRADELFTLTILTTNGVSAPPIATYKSGTLVTVQAPDAPDGLVFARWTGDTESQDNPIAVTMDRNITITAEYAEQAVNTDTFDWASLCGLGTAPVLLVLLLGLGFRWTQVR